MTTEFFALPAAEAERRLAKHPIAEDLAWPEPIPLGHEVPPFPVDQLPEPLRSFVVAEAETTQTPVDMAAMFALAAIATVSAGHLEVEAMDGWREPLNLFVAVAMDPGARKSAVYRDVIAPVITWESQLLEEERSMVADAASRRRIAEATLAKVEKQAAGAAGDDRRNLELEAMALARELAESAPLTLRRIFTADATPEAIAGLLAENGGVLSVLSAEGGIFDVMAGRYSNGIPNLDVFLSGHAGDTVRIDRRNRPPEYIERPALTIAVAVQPYVLRKIATVAEFAGRGLVDRFLFSVPASTVGFRETEPRPMPPDVREMWQSEILRLARLLSGHPDPVILRLSDGAAGLLHTWRRDIEPRRRPSGDLAPIQGWSSKLDGAVVRISGLLHLMEHGEGEQIHPVTMNRALRIGEYLIPHAQAAFDAMRSDRRLDDARHVLRWIKSGGRREFTRREAFHAAEHRFERVDDILPALRFLEDRSIIEREATDGDPGRPSIAYLVNPRIYQNHGQNGHNGISSVTSVVSEVPA